MKINNVCYNNLGIYFFLTQKIVFFLHMFFKNTGEINIFNTVGTLNQTMFLEYIKTCNPAVLVVHLQNDIVMSLNEMDD